MQNNLSVVILTHNDELRIVDCLESVQFADEIIIIDDESSDRTVELALQYTSKVFKRSLGKNFSDQRNFALNHAHGPWVLFVDSDERVTEELKKEIKESIKKNLYSGYLLKRADYMWGKRLLHGEAGNVKLLRLARKGYGRWRGRVHEAWRIKGNTLELQNPLIHTPHQSVAEFIREVDEYSSLRSNELHERGVKVSIWHVLLYPVAKFILNYGIKGGYKDGVAGFVFAMIMSFHSFLVRGKLFQKTNE